MNPAGPTLCPTIAEPIWPGPGKKFPIFRLKAKLLQNRTENPDLRGQKALQDHQDLRVKKDLQGLTALQDRLGHQPRYLIFAQIPNLKPKTIPVPVKCVGILWSRQTPPACILIG
jgi:hypothetical protein